MESSSLSIEIILEFKSRRRVQIQCVETPFFIFRQKGKKLNHVPLTIIRIEFSGLIGMLRDVSRLNVQESATISYSVKIAILFWTLPNDERNETPEVGARVGEALQHFQTTTTIFSWLPERKIQKMWKIIVLSTKIVNISLCALGQFSGTFSDRFSTGHNEVRRRFWGFWTLSNSDGFHPLVY